MAIDQQRQNRLINLIPTRHACRPLEKSRRGDNVLTWVEGRTWLSIAAAAVVVVVVVVGIQMYAIDAIVD